MCSRVDPYRPSRRGQRPGVVLIFVVAVLVLLAVIATTYLAMARTDRVPTEIKGGLPGGDSPPSLSIPLGEIAQDVHGWTTQRSTGNPLPNDDWYYRPAAGMTAYNNYLDTDYLDDENRYGSIGGLVDETKATETNLHTRQQHDPWLASRAPELLAAGGLNVPAWRKISRWIELWTPDDPKTPLEDESVWTFSGPSTDRVGSFESPYSFATNWAPGYSPAPELYRRTDQAIPSYIRIEYGSYPGTSFKTPSDYNQKVAIYPALKFPGDNKQYLAADADGDGVADSGLFSLNWWSKADAGQVGADRPFQDSNIPAGFYAPGDPQHPTRWYAAVRIVDATAAINVNTAWRRNADIALTPTGGGGSDVYSASGLPASGAQPNYGFFRSNVGLYELLLGQNNDQSQWATFMAYRLGRDPTNAVGSLTGVSSATGRGDYAFSTIGEALEMNLARRPVAPFGTPVYRSFPASLSSSLAYLNGLINPRVGRSDLEKALDADLYRNVPNWVAADRDSDKDKETRSFTFFAPPSTVRPPTLAAPPQDVYSPLLWWNSQYNPDDAAGGTRDTYFSSIGAYTGGTVPARTRRHLLTTSNPQSTSSRFLEKGAPAWLLVAPTDVTPMEKLAGNGDARPKGSINTDPFGVLWRQFYMAMSDPNYAASPPDPVVITDLEAPGHAILLDAKQSLYLRSAIAAVNAIDMRDTDDDITTVRIEIPGTPARHVMVAGCEKQLFINKVEVVAPSGVKALSISLLNPYDDATVGPGNGTSLSAVGYYIGIVPNGGGPPDPSTIVSVQTTAATVAPGTTGMITVPFPLPAPGAQGDIVLLRRRKADGSLLPCPDATKNYWDEGSTAAPKYDQLVCVDMVRFNQPFDNFVPPQVYDRGIVADWKYASTGDFFPTASTGARPNPIAVDNRPAGVAKPTPSGANQFPFGAFARIGDLMTIPYVGHYALYTTNVAGGTLLDTTPMTLDVQKVSPTPVISPQIDGRFMPIASGLPVASYANDWRSRIFDYFTVLGNPMSDYFPNMAKESWLNGGSVIPVAPLEVKDNDPAVPDYISPVHGLININTADGDVLNMVPWVTNTSGSVDPAANAKAVENILAYRRTNGPFKSTMDVMNVMATAVTPVFPQTVAGTNEGNFFAAGPLKTYGDKYNSFIRVSNLITTRSDAFVMYILLQQWQDFGSDKPLLVPNTEQRLMVLIDRSQMRNGSSAQPTGAIVTQTSGSN